MDKTLVGTEKSVGAVIRLCSINKVYRKIVQNSQENYLCWSLFLVKFQVLRPATLLKSDSSETCNFIKKWLQWDLQLY